MQTGFWDTARGDCLAELLLYGEQPDSAEDVAFRMINLVSDKGQEVLVCQSHRVLGMI